MMKRVLSFAAAILMMVSCALPCYASTDAQKNAAKSVARVVGVAGDQMVALSGIAVGNGGSGAQYFVTSSAVVENAEHIYIVLDSVDGSSDNAANYVKAAVIYTDSTYHFSILKTSISLGRFNPVSFGDAHQAETGQKVAIAGYIDSDRASKLENVQLTDTTIRDTNNSDYGHHGFLIADDINVGFLGGPMLDENGVCLGLTSVGQNSRGEAAALVVYAGQITSALDQYSIEYQTGSGGLSPWIWAVLGVVVLGVVLFVVFKSKKTPANGMAGAYPPQNTMPAGAPAGSATIPLNPSGIGAPPVERTAPMQPPAPAQSPMPPFADKAAPLDPIAWSAPAQGVPATGEIPYITGVKGIYQGNSFPVRDSVLVGRDEKRCQLIYPQGTPGVSSVHCELKNIGGALQIIDRGSAYGTFLSSGERLPANLPRMLQIGDVFYLATPSQTFQVTGGPR